LRFLNSTAIIPGSGPVTMLSLEGTMENSIRQKAGMLKDHRPRNWVSEGRSGSPDIITPSQLRCSFG
jgi:hypothetical protein